MKTRRTPTTLETLTDRAIHELSVIAYLDDHQALEDTCDRALAGELDARALVVRTLNAIAGQGIARAFPTLDTCEAPEGLVR